MELFTTYINSPLGVIRLQGNEKVITAINFIKEGEFIQTDSNLPSHFEDCCCQLQEYFAGNRFTFSFPVQQNGSEFQAKVWELLNQIPYGTTISYATLARQYGSMKAIRAIAAANGKNNLAIVVPCHRVIGSNAELVGYAGGLWRKKWLIEHEIKGKKGYSQLALEI